MPLFTKCDKKRKISKGGKIYHTKKKYNTSFIDREKGEKERVRMRKRGKENKERKKMGR